VRLEKACIRHAAARLHQLPSILDSTREPRFSGTRNYFENSQEDSDASAELLALIASVHSGIRAADNIAHARAPFSPRAFNGLVAIRELYAGRFERTSDERFLVFGDGRCPALRPLDDDC